MIITNPLLPFPFPFPGLFAGVTGSNPEMDGPTKVTVSSKKNIQTTRTVGGYTFSHWGDEPDNIQASGAVILMPGREGLGFLSLLTLKALYRLDHKKVNAILGTYTKVVSAAAMATSAAGELLSEKIALNNTLANNSSSLSSGASLVIDTTMKVASLELAMQEILKMSIDDLSTTYIYHDNYVYRGFFTNFSYTRNASNPRFIDYSFTFTVDWSTENIFIDILKSKNSNPIIGFGA